MITGYRVYKSWCQGAIIWDDGKLFVPISPGLISVVEAVDQIIYGMMQA